MDVINFMTTIKISNLKDEVVTFLDRKAEELSKISNRKITRNEYVNLILEKTLRDELFYDESNDDANFLSMLNTKFDLLKEAIIDDKDKTEELIHLIIFGDTGGERDD